MSTRGLSLKHMKRLFVAIDIPEVVRLALEALQEETRGFHWVAATNLHLTLKFIGDVDSELQEEIERTLGELQTEPFILPVESIGVFPAIGQPFVVWAGLGTGHPRLFGLQKNVEDRLFQLGIEPERHRYTPHLTLARCREASPEAVRQFVKKHREFTAPPFRVESFTLYSSLPKQGSSIYRVEKQWSLEPAKDPKPQGF